MNHLISYCYFPGDMLIRSIDLGSRLKRGYITFQMMSLYGKVTLVQKKNSVIVKAQIARPSSPYSRESIVHYNFLKLHYIRFKYVKYVTILQFQSLFCKYQVIPNYYLSKCCLPLKHI